MFLDRDVQNIFWVENFQISFSFGVREYMIYFLGSKYFDLFFG